MPQVKLFIETFTEQFSTFALLRASSKAQLKEREEKFIAGLKVRPCLLVEQGNQPASAMIVSLGARFNSIHAARPAMHRRRHAAIGHGALTTLQIHWRLLHMTCRRAAWSVTTLV